MKIRHILAVATAGLVLATTTAAHAAGPPYTVSVGGSSAVGSHPLSFASTGVVQLNFKNNAGTVLHWNCVGVSGSGTVVSGAAVNPVGSVGSTTWNSCSVPGMASTFTQQGAWSVRGTGSNATAGTETVEVAIDGFRVDVFTTANPNVCSYTISGSARASLNESTQQLVVSETGYSGNLVLSNVRGCLGKLQNGNTANFFTTLNVSTGGAGALNLS